ncbi:MAG: hypothetical protein JXR81_11520 [Candidatus Goldbacteria bacterium]|nr:hypothetical protein [Candidatus Goldiibacteriota bacterium]
MFQTAVKILRIFEAGGFKAVIKKAKLKIKRILFFDMPYNPARTAKGNNDFSAETGPLYTVDAPSKRKRLNLVTDVFENLFESAEVSFALAGSLAANNGMTLRIITREAPADIKTFNNFMEKRKLRMPKYVEFYSDYKRVRNAGLLRLEVSDNDYFIADSWKGASAITRTFKNKRFFWLLKESDTVHLPDNDARLLYGNTMNNANIDFFILSKNLYQRFNRVKARNVIKNSCYFQPVFSVKPEKASFAEKQQFRLLYTKRHDTKSGLYKTGLKIIDMAVSAGIIDTNKWRILMHGTEAGDFNFSDKSRPLYVKDIFTDDGAELAPTVDLTVSFNYSHCPDYKAVEMAAAGSVLLTNRDNIYSPGASPGNIIYSDLDKSAMLKAFGCAVKLAENPSERKGNYRKYEFARSWDKALAPVNEFASERLKYHA